MKAPPLRAIATTIVVSIVVAAGFLWWRADSRREILVRAMPAQPELAARPAELRARLASSEQRIRSGSGSDAVVALAELGRLYHANGFLEEAGQCYEGLEQLDEASSRWPYRHAMILAGFGQAESALPLLRRVVRQSPDYLPARLRLGELLFNCNDLAEAREVFTRALVRWPGEPYALLGLARCDIEVEKWESARAHLEQAVKATNFALGYDLIVTVYERLGMNDRAAAIRGEMKAWGAFRDFPDPWMDELVEDGYDAYQLSLAAGAAKRTGDVRTALRRLERAVALSPDNGMLRFQLALICIELREYSRAREQLERCTVLNPDFPDGWAHLSGLLRTVGDRAGAERILAEGLAHCADSPGLHLMRARQLKQAGRMAEAIDDLRTSIRLRPTEAEAYVELALTLFALDRVNEGIAEFERALGAEPEHPLVLSSLAQHAIIAGDEAEARQWLARAKNQPRVTPEDLDHLLSAFREKFGRAP